MFSQFKAVVKDLNYFLSGRALSIKNPDLSNTEHFKRLCAMFFLDLVLTWGAACLCLMWLGIPTEKFPGRYTSAHVFIFMPLTNMFEELYARALFLGFLAKLKPSSMWWFYAMFLLGNGSWALVHMTSFNNASALHCLPQFMGGIVLSYAFLTYGFVGCASLHIAYNWTLALLRAVV